MRPEYHFFFFLPQFLRYSARLWRLYLGAAKRVVSETTASERISAGIIARCVKVTQWRKKKSFVFVPEKESYITAGGIHLLEQIEEWGVLTSAVETF